MQMGAAWHRCSPTTVRRFGRRGGKRIKMIGLSSRTESKRHLPFYERSIRCFKRRWGEGGWGGGREGGAADGSVMPGSNAIHFSIIRLRHDPRHHLSPPCRLPAPHICSAGRSTSTPESPSDRLPVFPSQLCVEAPHLPEGRCLAAPLSLARPINSFNSAPWRPTPRFALLSCPQSWVGGGGCRDRGGC